MEVHTGPDVRVPIPAAKQRAILACVALNANRTVTVDALAGVLWGSKEPPNAKPVVQNYVARLRRVLGPAAERLATGDGGYRLTVREDAELDHLQAAALDRRARRAVGDGDWAAGGRLAERALALWRGDVLEDVPSEGLRTEFAPSIEEVRRGLEEVRVDACLAAARFDDALPHLDRLIAAQPLREPLHERRLAALYAAGQRADALECYRRVRSTLRDELGIEPSPTLRGLYQLVLDDAPAADLLPAQVRAAAVSALAAARSGPSDDAPAPIAQLPSRPRLLIGRARELARLDRLLIPPPEPKAPGALGAPRTADTSGTPGTPGTPGAPGSSRAAKTPGAPGTSGAAGAARFAGTSGPDTGCHVAVLTGPAGVGKTTLALTWAHRVAAHFPDGILHLDLAGFAPGLEPLAADAAVVVLLDLLGVRLKDLPDTPEGRAALYRRTIAGRRLLVLLDNAADARQARPLLPAGEGSRALVTSRRSLGGLVALDGAEPLTLAPFDPGTSRELLVRRLGERRVAGQEDALEAIAGHCAHLPLALSVAVARAAALPGVPLAAFVEQLDTAVLDTLVAGDEASSVRDVLSWSYRRLSEEVAHVFRFLGLHPGPEITPAAAAALAGVGLGAASEAVGELATMSLLSEPAPGRFAMHALLQMLAVELLEQHTDEAERRAAKRRLYDYHLRLAVAADDLTVTLALHVEPDHVPLPAGLEPKGFADEKDAAAWLVAEEHVLTSLVADAAATGHDSFAWRLAGANSCNLMRREREHKDLEQGRIALGAARRLDEPAALARANFQYGRALTFSRHVEDAEHHLSEALRLYRELDDQPGVVECVRTLASLWHWRGDLARSGYWREEYLKAAQELGHQASQAMAWNYLAWSRLQHGRRLEALSAAHQALAMFGESPARNRPGFQAALAMALRANGDARAAAQIHDEPLQDLNEVELLVELGMMEAAGEFFGWLDLRARISDPLVMGRVERVASALCGQAPDVPAIAKPAAAVTPESSPR
jgi:DNA-binding SARP family transcriptional activator